MRRVCKTCKVEKDITKFHKTRVIKGKQYYNRNCKLCHLDYYRQKRADWHGWLNKLKSDAGCARCPEARYWVLDFHHKDGKSDKKHNIAYMANDLRPKPIIEKEIKKCIVMCSNCHRDLHFKEHLNEAQNKS